MNTVAVIDALWGDSGKGKIVDYLSDGADFAVRFNGGANAGHSVEMDDGKRHKVHMLPVAAYTPGVICGLGAGMVINPRKLISEINLAKEINPGLEVFIDFRAHVVTDQHIQMDKYNEDLLGGQKIGTTLTGNGPAYADKAARVGIRMKDLLKSPNEIKALLKRSLSATVIDCSTQAEELHSYGKILGDYVTDGVALINEAVDLENKVLFAGAHGTLLDIDFGQYPGVTSSSCTVSGIGTGAGVSPRKIDQVIGVVKAYSTRVGSGFMPTEIEHEPSDLIRDRGKEYGTTTGRPRRVGWLDLPMVKYSAMINGFDYLAITLLDVLGGIEPLQICTHYRKGKFPAYTKIPTGWESDLSECRLFDDLPDIAKYYVNFIQEQVGVPVGMISVGPRRSQIIDMRKDRWS